MPLFHMIASILIGFLLGMTNLYLGLRLGFVYGVAVMAAFGMALLCRLPGVSRPDDARLACQISLVSAMSFGCGTVIATSLAAVVMISEEPLSPFWMSLWVTAICGTGTLLAYPLRTRMLRRFQFPSGKVAATTVSSLARGETRLRSFAMTGSVVATWVLLRDWLAWIPGLIRIPMLPPLPNAPFLGALGVLLGVRVCLSMFLGGSLFFIFLPRLDLADDAGMWWAVGTMVSATLIDFVRSLRGTGDDTASGSPGLPAVWKWGTVLCLVVLVTVHTLVFGWQPLAWLLLLPMLWVFSLTACRVTGETDVVPTGALGKLALLLFGLGRPEQMTALMGSAGVLTGASASAADFTTDLRTGEQLGCGPERQLPWQLTGALIGPLIFVPLFFVLIERHELGGAVLAAPAARIWTAVAEALGSGAGGVPFLTGLISGAILLAMSRTWSWFPNPVALALAAFLDWGTTAVLLAGALAAKGFPKLNSMAGCSAVIASETIVQMIFLI